ncbi:MAG TPA: hypothetical protein PK263_02225 [bacterium]|nr:hypothetical protein [bacterium]
MLQLRDEVKASIKGLAQSAPAGAEDYHVTEAGLRDRLIALKEALLRAGHFQKSFKCERRESETML